MKKIVKIVPPDEFEIQKRRIHSIIGRNPDLNARIDLNDVANQLDTAEGRFMLAQAMIQVWLPNDVVTQ